MTKLLGRGEQTLKQEDLNQLKILLELGALTKGMELMVRTMMKALI
jgi:hypothetical protein